MKRTMYAVAPQEGFAQDAVALFEDEATADEFCETISNDPDRGCEYAVQAVWLNGNAIEGQEEPTP